MSSITGLITVAGAEVGVPGLTIHAYDVALTQEELSATGLEGAAKAMIGGKLGRRLGSADSRRGQFRIDYEYETGSNDTGGRKGPNLALVIIAPEIAGLELAKRILHVTELRGEAAPSEFFRIILDREKLKELSLPLPGITEPASEDPQLLVDAVAAEADRREKIRVGLRKLASDRVQAKRATKDAARRAWRDSLLARLNRTTGAATSTRYVDPDGDTVEAGWAAAQEGVKGRVVGQSSQAGYVLLSDEQVEALQSANNGSLDDLPASSIEYLIFKAGEDAPRRTSLIRENPIAAALKKSLENPAANQPQPAQPAQPSTTETTDVILDPDNLSGQIERLLGTMDSPEGSPSGKRAEQDDIDKSISNFALHKGPADVPAYYDFHSLQIAFDYVWQHAMDEGVIELGTKVIEAIGDLGGDGEAALKSEKRNPLRALKSEMSLALEAQGQTSPTIMARKNERFDFDPTKLPEYEPIDTDTIVVDPVQPGDPRADIDESVSTEPPRPYDLLSELENRLRAPYAFTIFAPGTVNFGILLNYRQCWEPGEYQAGSLLRTITLTPRESRKYNIKTTIKKRRAIKEAENNQSSLRQESNTTMRDEAEIVARAEAKTNFSLSTQGSYKLGPIAEGDSTTSFTRDVSSSSQETKRAFREAVIKAAQERRDEIKHEVETEETFEQEVTETQELTNTNEEIPVTYLFYELQRRFRVSEELHRVVPVVLVAQPVPAPHEIDYDWLIEHDWIIRRFLPDDSFVAALNYLSTRVRGDELALDHMRYNLDMLRQAVTELRQSLVTVRKQVSSETRALEDAVAERISATKSDSGAGNWISDLFTDDDDSTTAARMKEDFARETFERQVKKEKELFERLERETTALQTATDAYAKAVADNVNQKIQIARLALHVKNNIYTYLHGIWSYEHPDQRFFRLHGIKVPQLKVKERHYSLTELDACPLGVSPQPGKKCYEVTLKLELEPTGDPDNPLPRPEEEFATVAELCHLGQPLGFVGNCIMLPLKESNALTDFMMMPYVDAELGLRDPDEFGNWTIEQFRQYVETLRSTMPADQFVLIAGELSEQYKKLITSPRRDGEEIIVPTNSIFVEALPGKHPVLEDFKLLHRGMDVKKVQAEIRHLELENVRLAARLMKGEREDADIDRKIIVETPNEVIVDPNA